MSPVPQGPPAGWPPAEVEITDETVRDLLATQHPDLSGHSLARVGNGWDNVTYRLGADLAVRLPRRRLAAELILSEQKWLPRLVLRLPVPIPAPIRIGKPGSGYPWPWSVVPWIDGVSATVDPLHSDQAGQLGGFLRKLHVPGPTDAPRNPYRGVPLATRSDALTVRLDRIDPSLLPVPRQVLRDLWLESVAAPIDVNEVWLHGDLHPSNVIVSEGRLAAVVDWGDVCIGDPATDLAAAWMQFPREAHSEFWEAYGTTTAATWQRARGWAIHFGLMLVDSGSDDEAWSNVGSLILERACV